MVWVLLLLPPSNNPLNETLPCHQWINEKVNKGFAWPSLLMCEQGELSVVPKWERINGG